MITNDGKEVTVTGQHMDQHQEVMAVLPEALLRINTYDNESVVRCIDLGRIIGKTQCVPVEPGESILWARREGRKTMSKFVKFRSEVDCSKVCVVLIKSGNSYRLVTAYIGEMSFREPDDKTLKLPLEKLQANNFWNTHALVWGSQTIVPLTETLNNPWTNQ